MLAEPQEKSTDEKKPHHDNHRDDVEKVRDRNVFIVYSHEKLQDCIHELLSNLYWVFSLHEWRKKASRTFAGTGKPDGTAPYSSDIANVLPHAVHSYAITFPNRTVRGTSCRPSHMLASTSAMGAPFCFHDIDADGAGLLHRETQPFLCLKRLRRKMSNEPWNTRTLALFS